MAQKVKVRRVDGVKDAVIFMTAYHFHDVKRRIRLFTLAPKVKDLMKQYHINCFSTDHAISSQSGKYEFSMLHNHVTQHSEFRIIPKKKVSDMSIDDAMKELKWVIPLRHAETLLLGEDGLEISFCINMESFLVCINDEILQVDPIIFSLKGTLIIGYELIHFDSGIPFAASEIYGRDCNYNILPVSSLRYFDESVFSDDDRKISDIIFENITHFLDKALRKKYKFGSHSFVHNIYVRSNHISNVDLYFQKVAGAEISGLHLSDVSPQSQFSYYATEFLGLVSNLTPGENENIFYECLLLEAMKMYLCLEMIVEYDISNKLSNLLDRKMYLEHFYYPGGAPIITHNAIENFKKTNTYKQYDKAIRFKIEALKDIQERKRISNGIFLNVLLYVLAALGGLQAVDILADRYGLSFSLGFAVVVILFGGLGILWYRKEKNN